jgi:hypothetical protein
MDGNPDENITQRFLAIFVSASTGRARVRTIVATRWSTALAEANLWSASQADETWVLKSLSILD